MSDGVDKMLAMMTSYLGIHGRPNAITRWYASRHGKQYLREAWCDMTVSRAGFDSKQPVGEEAYTPSHLDWFRAQGLAGTKPKRGAIVFFNWTGGRNGQPEHVGVVQGISKDGKILVTLEGNTDDRVARKTRSTKYVVGYGYPKYTSAVAYPGHPLVKGSKGDLVRVVQQALVAAGYPLTRYGVDGAFGDETKNAVRAYQRVKKLPATGIVDPATWKALVG